MTDTEYNHLVDLRNKCYQDRRDRETDITYFTGFNDGYEKGKESLTKKNTELDCQKNRNKVCYSCANATERCFRNEIGCPCEKYKSYKDENAELKKKNLNIQDAVTMQMYTNRANKEMMDKQLTKAKEIIKTFLGFAEAFGYSPSMDKFITEAEQFIKDSEVEK